VIEYIGELIGRYGKKGVLLDTPLLLLLFMGRCDRAHIPRWKKTNSFTCEDYDTLVHLLKPFQKIVTIPNILTEVSNHAGMLMEKHKSDYFLEFEKELTTLDEQYVKSLDISRTKGFRKFGITDAGIALLARDSYLVITTDFALAQYLPTVGVEALNFNHVRPLYWQ
jgi:hypothetical protein